MVNGKGDVAGTDQNPGNPGVSVIEHPALKEPDAKRMTEVYMADVCQHIRCSSVYAHIVGAV